LTTATTGEARVEIDAAPMTVYQLLSDIIGWEDAFCDMDCKIAGTDKGITGFQLDLKLRGLPHEIMTEAVEKARVARLFILEEMAKTLAAPRPEISKYAPRIITIRLCVCEFTNPGTASNPVPSRTSEGAAGSVVCTA